MTHNDPIAHATAVLVHAEAHDCTCATVRTDVLRRLIDAYALWTAGPEKPLDGYHLTRRTIFP